jgi:type I restriction enzyme M protein
MSDIKPFLTTDELEEGGYLEIDGNQVIYLASKIKRRITDPEERVRAEYYLELIKKYKYPDNRIQPNKNVSSRKPNVYADLVVFEDDEKKKPYIVVECKKDGISQAEIRQAIEQVFGYANSLRAKYAVVVAGTIRIAFDIAGFKPSEREKNIIADIPERYGKVIKFRFKKEDSVNDLKVATREELLAKFQQCHDTLWEGGKRNPAEAFDEMSKLMFCKISDERFITKKNEYYKFQIGTHETLKEVIKRIRGIYSKAQKKDPGVFTEKIKAEDFIIYSVVELLQGISLARTELDIKGEAFEHFLGGVFRQAMGQYFTPRPIVKFMVDMLEPDEDDKIIDPACGSGGFLLYTLERVKQYLEDTLAPKDALDSWKDFALYQLFGIEINSQLARVAMMNMILHEDGHSNIENNDALDDPSKFHPRRDIKSGKYTLLLTNPPFGAVVKIREHSYLANYELGAKVKFRNRQNTEILFIEKCLDFLCPGGRMGIVLPDGILTNSSLQYVRDFITDNAQILAVVSLPQTAFRRPHAKGGGGVGSGVKASLLFLRKKKEGEKLQKNYPIFMAIAEHIGYDSTGRPDKNEFPDIVRAYQEFRKKKKIDFFVETPLCFNVGWGELEGRLDPSYHKPEFKTILKSTYPVKKLSEITDRILCGPFGTAIKSSAYTKDGIPFIRITNIKLGEFDSSNLVYISEEDSKRLASYRLRGGDLIISQRGTLGNVCQIPKKIKICNISANTIGIIPSQEVNPNYILYYLISKSGQKQLKRFTSGHIQNKIVTNDVKSILIPLPPRDIQKKIANMMEEAYRVKREKDKEAEELLNSIDDYILTALEITLPELKDEQFYTVAFANIKGDRIDPFYYQSKYKKLYEALEGGKFELVRISQVIDAIEYGLMPTQDYAKSAKEGVPMIRVTNITRNGEINMDDAKFIPYSTPNLKNKILQGGEVLIVQCGNTTGKTAFVNDQFKGYTYGSFILSLRADKLILPQYLEVILSQRLIQMQIWRSINVTTVRPSTSKPKILNIRIPLPPLSTQQKIAEEVKSHREKAKTLTKEAKAIIIKTKGKVERIIIGEKNQIRR